MKEGYKQTAVGVIPEKWIKVSFSSIANVIMGQSPKGDSYNQNQIGVPLINGPTEFTKRFPIKKQWTTAPTKICNSGDILLCVRGSSTGRINIANDKYCIGRGVAAIRSKKNVDHYFVEQKLNQIVERILGLTTGSTFPNIDSKSIKSIDVLLPPLPEQQKIAEVLGTWDKAIESCQALIRQLKTRNRGLAQQLLTGQTRLPGFSGEWEEKRLAEYFTERKETGFGELPLLSIGEIGVYPQDQSNKKDTSNSDKQKYKRICPGDIGYNTMRMWQGRSALSNLKGIVSPAYTIVTPKANAVPDFFRRLFKVPSVVHKFFQNSQGLVSDTWNCKFKDFKIVKVTVPSTVDEQKAIADILQKAEDELKLYEDKLAALQLQKKGLMQKLLTGEVRVNC